MLRILKFLRITDEGNNLSITNLLVSAISTKLLLIPTIDPTVIIGFVLALLQYAHKRHIMLKTQSDNDDVVDKLLVAAKEEVTQIQEQVKVELSNTNTTLVNQQEVIDKLQNTLGFKSLTNQK